MQHDEGKFIALTKLIRACSIKAYPNECKPKKTGLKAAVTFFLYLTNPQE